MNPKGLSFFLKYLLKIGLCLATLTPLLVSPSTYFPFVVGKAISFQIIVEALLIIYLILILLDAKERPRLNFLSYLVMAYFLIVTLASALGIDWNFSFWTNYERMDGLFNLYHFGIYFFLLFNVFSSRRDWLFFFRTLLGTMILIDFLGLLQKNGLTYLAKFSEDRAFSTLGNATYMGVQAVFQIFIALFLFVADKNFAWRFYYLFNVFLGGLAILISKTRGSLLAIFIGGLIFFVLASLFSEKHRRKIFLSLFLGGTVFLALLAFIFSHPDWAVTKILPDRLNIFASNLSLETRGVVWQTTFSAWKSRPLLGWGRASHGFVFAPFYNPKIASFEDVWFDKPHNKALEVMSDSGTLGLLAYLAVFGGVIYIFWRKRDELYEASFFLISLVAAYFTQNIFLFDFQASYLWWFSLIGFAAFLSMPMLSENKPKNKSKKQSLNLLKVFASGSLILLMVIAFVAGNVRPLMAAKRGVRALSLEYQGQKADKVLPLYESAFSLGSFGNQEILSEMVKGFSSLKRNSQAENFATYYDFALEKEEKLYQERPHDIKSALILGNLYQMKFQEEEGYIAKAEKLYKDLIARAPKKFDPYYQLIFIKFNQRELEEMNQLLRRLIELNPRYYRHYFEVARLAFASGDRDKGRIFLARATQERFPWYYPLTADFLKDDDCQWFIKLYERVLKVDPGWTEPHLLLASFYGKIKNQDKMVEHLKEAVRIHPGHAYSIKKVLGIDI